MAMEGCCGCGWGCGCGCGCGCACCGGCCVLSARRRRRFVVVGVCLWDGYLFYSNRILFERLICAKHVCLCFCLTSTEIDTFLLKKRDTAKRVVDFPRERDTFRNKIMEIVQDFDEKSYINNNG